MLEKLGGKEVLSKATDTFYNRQINDERLAKFFHGADLMILKWHQFNLMSIAFTEVPESFDVEHLILVRHKQLFDKGLDETYFDRVMGHFSETLKEMKVDQQVIDDACNVVFPLRSIFLQGANEAKERKKQQTRQGFWTEGLLVLAGVVAIAVHQSRKKAN
ncbi:unnamed protein product [Cylindrotheca closterium]|uniref:Uncharacterized protein n=1 Tax=Cylindrotheca closterium TaxID=2856 RepID=A0AAD2GBT2_9STRA|nr:unnamed protein product [Cylindrotheca closterium]